MGLATKQQPQQQRSTTFASARSGSTSVAHVAMVSGNRANSSRAASTTQSQVTHKGLSRTQPKGTAHNDNYYADTEGTRAKLFLAESHQAISLQGNRAPVRNERAIAKTVCPPSSQPSMSSNTQTRAVAPGRVRPGLSASSPIVPRISDAQSTGSTTTSRSYSTTSPSVTTTSGQSSGIARPPHPQSRSGQSVSPTNRATKEAAVEEFRSKTMQRLAEKKEHEREEQKALSKMAKAADEKKQEMDDEKCRMSKEALRRRAEIYAVNGLMRKLEESKMDAFNDRMEGGKNPFVYT